MPLIRTTAPTQLPFTIDELRKHLRVDITDDDDLILSIAAAVVDYTELRTRRSIMPQAWQLVLDGFPGPSLIGVPYGQQFTVPGHSILLEKAPIVSLDSIKFLDMSGTQQTLSPTGYVAELTSEPARVTPPFGQIWPINLPQIGSVQCNFTTGYANAAAVPAGLKTWMKLRIGAIYENREEIVVGTRIVVSELPYVDGLIDHYVIRYF